MKRSSKMILILITFVSPIIFFNNSLTSSILTNDKANIEVLENYKGKSLLQSHTIFYDQRNFYRVLATPITITNNNEFTTAGFSGTGTQGDPYVLNDTFIISSGPTGIHIQDTDAYFSIDNVTISGATESGANGITLQNVTSGLIGNNTITEGESGIMIWSSHNNTISHNLVSNQIQYGIAVTAASHYNIIEENTLTENNEYGILVSNYMGPSTFNIVEKNTVKNDDNGIYIKGNNNTVTDNTVIENNIGIVIYEGHNNTISHNMVTKQIDYGISVTAASQQNRIEKNMIVENNKYGILVSNYLGASNFNVFEKNTIKNHERGIYIKGSHNNCLIENSFLNNSYLGIYLYAGSQNNNLTRNTLSENADYGIVVSAYLGVSSFNILEKNSIKNTDGNGISLHGVHNTTLTWNSLFNNTGYGLYLNSASYNNSACWNNFFHNNGEGIQAYDGGVGNHFAYNHWNDLLTPDDDNDGFIDTPYQFEGRTNPALWFDGSDDRVDSTDFALNNNFTIELWAYISNPWRDQYMISKHDAGGNNLVLFGTYQNSYNFYFNLGGNSSGFYAVARPFDLGWEHLGLVGKTNSTHTNVTFYRNGQVLDHRSLLGRLNDAPGTSGLPWAIGQEYDPPATPSNHFLGWLDEIRFLNQSLTGAQVFDNYLTGGGWYPTQSDTVAWYHFDENEGTSVTDSSGNSNTGTVYGGASWTNGTTLPPWEDEFPRVGPIWINENADFANFTNEGNGTINDPYIIEGFDFTSGVSNLIYIENINTSFVLQNVLLNGTGSGIGNGVTLVNVSHAILANNSINSCVRGIEIQGDSANNSVIHNNIEECDYGIFLDSVENNSLLSNLARYNYIAGFQIQNSNNTFIEGNYAKDNLGVGFFLWYCGNQTFLRNKAYRNNGSGFYFFESNNCTLTNNTAYLNNQSGYYLQQSCKYNILQGNTATRNVFYGFLLFDYCDNNTLKDNTASENQYIGFQLIKSSYNDLMDNLARWNIAVGFGISYSHNNRITTNNASDNGHLGFYFYDSDYNSLQGNIAENNENDGFSLTSSNYNNLTENVAKYNNGYGIFLHDSSENIIFSNIFLRNTEIPQGYDLLEYNNNWSLNGQGNYWSDYPGNDSDSNGIGDTPYNLTEEVVDPHPLFYAVHPSLSNLQIISDGNVVIEITDADVIGIHNITWVPSTNLEPTQYVIYREHEAVETGYWFSEEQILIPVDVTILEERREYNYTLQVRDYSSNTVTDTVMITIRDTIPPELINMSAIAFVIDEGEEKAITFTFRAMDDSLHLFKLYQADVILASWTLLFNDYGEIDFDRIAECWRPSTEEVAEHIVVSLDSLSVSSTSVNLVTTMTIGLTQLGGGTYNYNLTAQDYVGNIDWMIISVTIIGPPAKDSPGWTTPTVILAILGLIPIFSQKWRKKREGKVNEQKEV